MSRATDSSVLHSQLIESQLDQWMAEFHTFLAFPDNPALAESDPEKESVLDAVRSAACQNINLVGCCVCHRVQRL